MRVRGEPNPGKRLRTHTLNLVPDRFAFNQRGIPEPKRPTIKPVIRHEQDSEQPHNQECATCRFAHPFSARKFPYNYRGQNAF